MEDSRGQIILVAALAIAVTLVALALVVNTVIFTENLATRETASGQEAVAFQEMVGESGEALLWRANEYNNSTYDNVTNTFRRDIGLLGESENLHAVSGGSLRDIQVVSIHNGTKIQQSTLQHVNDTEDNTTWVAAPNVTGTRSFRMDIDTITNPSFKVNVTNGSTTWAMIVTDTPDVLISNNGTLVGTCSLTGDKIIELTNGSVSGTSCTYLNFAEGVAPPYTISFENGDNVTATYQLIVDRNETELMNGLPAGEENNYDDTTVDPTLYPAIYNSTVNISVESSDMSYTSNVTLQPEGEPAE